MAAGGVIRRGADIDGCMPWPLSVCEVVCAESVKFAAHCREMTVREEKESVKVI